MRVSLLAPSDALTYRALMLEAYATAPDAFTSTVEDRMAEPDSFWHQRIAHPAGLSVAFGAIVESRMVGTVALEFSSKPKTRHKASLIGMYVAPTARGMGAGQALLDAAIAYAARRDGVLRLNLTVTEGNTSAINLYRRAGFAIFGVEPMAILAPDGVRTKVHMSLPITRPAA